MTEDIQKQNSFGSTVKNALIFPAVMQGGAAIGAVKRAGGVKKAINALEVEKFKALNTQLKTTHKDIFSRSAALAENYDKYKGLYKTSSKDTKKLAKAAKKGKISLKDSFFNLFKSADKKTTLEGLKEASKKSSKEFRTAKQTLKNGQEIVEATTKTGFKETAKGLAKKELTSKFNLAISALTTFLPAVKENVIPAFKEEGFGAGVKELAKATARTASDFVAYGVGGALGRTIGGAIGTFICPGVGSAIGATVGDAVGSMVVGGKICETVDKAIGAEEEVQDAQNGASQSDPSQSEASKQTFQGEPSFTGSIEQAQPAQEIAQQETAQQENIEQPVETSNSTETDNSAGENSIETTLNTQEAQNSTEIEQNKTEQPKQEELSFEEARAKYDKNYSAQIENEKPKSKYIKPQNGVYATSWVNDMNKEKKKQETKLNSFA